jgi:DNA primase
MIAAPVRRPAALLRPARAHFDRERLPDPADYYSRELPSLRGRGVWRDALCPFHEDSRPSLRVNVQTGGWRCMACGRGGDLLSFHMRRHGLGFADACKALGAWVGGRRHD